LCCVVGGDEALRRYWWEYLRKTDTLVFVVDSADRRRLPLARRELQALLAAELQVPVVVLANKQVAWRRAALASHTLGLYSIVPQSIHNIA